MVFFGIFPIPRIIFRNLEILFYSSREFLSLEFGIFKVRRFFVLVISIFKFLRFSSQGFEIFLKMGFLSREFFRDGDFWAEVENFGYLISEQKASPTDKVEWPRFDFVDFPKLVKRTLFSKRKVHERIRDAFKAT